MTRIIIQPAYSAAQMGALLFVLFLVALGFVYLGLTAIDKTVSMNEGIHQARCERHYIPGYCAGYIIARKD